ncbi:hypothetical protein ES332_D12G203100v1 [Gossypium tomentosum]|uniref:UDP-glycosyltransferases domain-containing protein n=1 Tax=Gossypium tomentosum TaxID=34277 RepID=A0A5D2ID28_GOSTO|nr:hypothetical protein ES332_D12G203100v1 [Gossypium tomentosum]
MNRKPHVAVLPNLGLGHLIPQLEFAKRLVVHHGIHVSLLLITTNEPSPAQDQLLSSSHLPPDLHIVPLPPVEVDKKIINDGDVLVLTRLCVITDHSLRSLKSVLIALGKPNALVTDIFATQAFDVCKELLIPTYVGGTLSFEQQTELAWGLELSQQRFIWVVRKPTDSTGAGTFFNAGETNENDPKVYLPEGFLDRTQGVGFVVSSWAPQVTILGHHSTGGFLSHCGWNSVLESIVHGVHLVTWPLYAEQRMNSTMLVEDIGVAIKPKMEAGQQNIVGRKEIERVVGMVMEGEEGKVIRSRVKELKESATKALDSSGSSYESLSCVANYWKANHN